jgi:hypothetical protein
MQGILDYYLLKQKGATIMPTVCEPPCLVDWTVPLPSHHTASQTHQSSSITFCDGSSYTAAPEEVEPRPSGNAETTTLD